MAAFIGKLKGNDATAVRKKKFSEGTLRYSLFKETQVKTTNAAGNLKVL
jgi:hypothetical protein